MSDHDDGIKGQIAEAERIAFENAAPLSLEQLKELFSELNRQTLCRHNYAGTLAFIQKEGLDPARVLSWLKEYGGHCDCEVIHNVYDHFCELAESRPARGSKGVCCVAHPSTGP